MLWEIEVSVRSQREEAEFLDLNRNLTAECKNETDVAVLLWRICLQPILRITGELEGTPFSGTVRRFASEYEKISETQNIYSTGGGGFILEDFNFELWEKSYVIGLDEDDEDAEYFETYYRAAASGSLLVEADSKQEAIELVSSEGANVFHIWTDSDTANGAPFFRVEQVLIESVKPAQ
jgi:hypothetical protein